MNLSLILKKILYLLFLNSGLNKRFILFLYNVEIIFIKANNLSTIKEYLTNDHRKCDDLFAKMEKEASTSLSSAADICQAFIDDMERHFQMEERVMFLEFEQKTGMTQGPTAMMRQEHMQMRGLMSQLLNAINTNNKDKFFGLSETLMILLQQHNMKEEQMLYTMAQQHLSSESDRIVEMMDSLIVE
jgi:hemerythrin-like domain-containing protein